MAVRAQDDSRGRFDERTLGVWQPRTDRALTAEDAREIARNITGFLGILRGWEAAERAADGTPGCGDIDDRHQRSRPGGLSTSKGKDSYVRKLESKEDGATRRS